VTVPTVRRGDRVEAHPHRPRVLAGESQTISTRRSVAGARVEYLGTLILEGPVAFTVAPAGLARSHAEGVRNVHAFARGRVLAALLIQVHPEPQAHRMGWVRVTYNPFKRDHFYRVDTVTDDYGDEVPVPGPQVTSADYVWLVGGDCWAFNPTYA